MTNDSNTGGWQAGLIKRTGRFGDDKDPNMGKDTQFKPGQSGNPKGGTKGKKKLSTVIQDMLNDPKFIDKLNAKIAEELKQADPDFQGTPVRAIVTTAIIEAISPQNAPAARNAAREWLAKYGYGTKVDVTSDGERIQQAPLVISSFDPRGPGGSIPSEEAQEDLDSHTNAA